MAVPNRFKLGVDYQAEELDHESASKLVDWNKARLYPLRFLCPDCRFTVRIL